MKDRTRSKDSNAAPARLAASAIAAAAILVAVAGTTAHPAGAAAAGKASHTAKKDGIKRPKLRNGALTVEGTAAADRIALRLKAGQSGLLQVDAGDDGTADFTFRRADVASIVVAAAAGDDRVRIDEVNGAFTDAIPTTIEGGDGGDDLAGGSGAERFFGGNGNDTVDGNRGADVAFLGSGTDTFVWDPGDASDVVEGQDGADTMRFNGADIAEQFELSANGSRLRLTRNIGSVTMDADGVERVDLHALGGADLVKVHDLTGLDVSNVDADLEGAPGAGDGQIDRVVVEATTANDTVNLTGDASGVLVTGPAAPVAIRHQDANDALEVDGLGGNDAVSAGALAQPIALTLDGGAGDDTLTGGRGVEVLIGGDGTDSLDGNGGNDLALMGAGDDTFVWDPGDGSDVVEGQDGLDTMLFNGANIAERVELAANGGRLRFTRDIGTITMDTNDVERVVFKALGGTDTVTVGDLAGTDVLNVVADLSAVAGGGDGVADRVLVDGTNGDDVIVVAGGNGTSVVTGLSARVDVTSAEPANDRLTIRALAGDDVVLADGLASTSLALALEGDAGNDILIGSAGNDALLGGDGDDLLVGGPGLDVLDGGPGDNVLLQD